MTMHKDPKKISGSPFQDRNDLENFFTGGGRAEVLSELHASVLAGVPLLIITGEEGSGKTTICRVLEQRLAKECVVINFPETVESFEDVVRIIGHNLGVVTAEINDGKELRSAIGKIAEFLLEKKRHLLIIFDGAENIYLATLERIRKMLGQMTEAGVSLHVLFSGKPSFLENYDQLIICDFKQIEEQHSSLSPLSAPETADYLNSCIESYTGDGVRTDMFTEEAVEKIHAIAKGNFSMINVVAEDSIAISTDDSSFMVSPDNVTGEEGEQKAGWNWPQTAIDFKRFIPYLPWVGGSLSILLVLLLVFGSGNKQEKERVAPSEEIAEQKQAVIVEQEKLVTPDPVEKTVTTVEETATLAEEAIIVEDEIPPVYHEFESEVEITETDVIEESAVDDEIVQETIITDEKEKEIVTPEVEAEPVQEEEVIVELRQSPSLKKKVGTPEPVRKNKIVVQPRKEVQKVTATKTNYTVDQLYSRRIAAGREWRYGVKDSMYTIQLMSLTSKNAEHNLKLMLGQEKYRKQAANFFIFRKNSSPAAILVYYGEYPTITEARRTLKSIPAFLQRHKPYAISIKGAVAKIKK